MEAVAIINNQLNICPTLTNDEQKFIVASLNEKRIKVLTEQEIKAALTELIGKAVFEAGQSIDLPKIVGISNSLYPDLKNYFTTLSLKDIELAFNLGVRKIYGEFMGINVTTLFNWLKAYTSDPNRNEAKKKQNTYLIELNKPKEPTPAEIEKIMLGGCNEAYEAIKAGQYYDDIGNAVYNFIDRKNKIPFSAERKQQFMKAARQIILGQKNDQFKTAKGLDINKIKKEIESLNENSNEVVIEAKKLVLNKYLIECNELGLTMEEILNG